MLNCSKTISGKPTRFSKPRIHLTFKYTLKPAPTSNRQVCFYYTKSVLPLRIMRTNTTQHARVHDAKSVLTLRIMRTYTTHYEYFHYATCVGKLRKKRTNTTHDAYLYAILGAYYNMVGVSRMKYEELFAFPNKV